MTSFQNLTKNSEKNFQKILTCKISLGTFGLWHFLHRELRWNEKQQTEGRGRETEHFTVYTVQFLMEFFSSLSLSSSSLGIYLFIAFREPQSTQVHFWDRLASKAEGSYRVRNQNVPFLIFWGMHPQCFPGTSQSLWQMYHIIESATNKPGLSFSWETRLNTANP